MIQHLGAFDMENLGDRIYPVLLRKLGIETNIVGVRAKRMPEYETVGINEIEENCPLLIGGGDILRADKCNLESYFGVSPWPARFVNGFGVRWPATYLSVGVPFQTPHAHGARFLWARDKNAATNFQRDKATVVAPDLAVLAPEVFKKAPTKPVALIQFSVSMGGEIAPAIQKLRESYEVRLVSINHYSGDEVVMQPTAKQMGLPVHRIESVPEFIEAISGASLVVAASMHANILAFAYGVPHFFVPLPYLNKVDGFLGIVGLPNRLALSKWSDLNPKASVVDARLRERAQKATRDALTSAMQAAGLTLPPKVIMQPSSVPPPRGCCGAQPKAEAVPLLPAPVAAPALHTTPVPEMTTSGPLIWSYGHAGAKVLLTSQDRLRLVKQITGLIPCRNCRLHWDALISAHPPETLSAKAFEAWLVARHNDINERLGKPKWP